MKPSLNAPLSPLAEDTMVKMAAERGPDAIAIAADYIGLNVYTLPELDIDIAELPAKYFRRVPDYRWIQRDLKAGIPVPGAKETDRVKYVLTRGNTEVE